jgi:hypothetical protein
MIPKSNLNRALPDKARYIFRNNLLNEVYREGRVEIPSLINQVLIICSRGAVLRISHW